MANNRVIFRVDSGFHIGMGHLMRCMKLAQLFKKRGYDCLFICKDHEDSNYKILQGFKTIILSGGVKKISSAGLEKYSNWLGTDVNEEIRVVQKYLSQSLGIFIDHYGINSDYERKLSGRIFTFDDLMEEQHASNVVINANINVMESYYKGHFAGKLLLGPEYFISGAYEEKWIKNRPYSLQKIGVFFGGSDATSETLKLLKALAIKPINYEVHLILPLGIPHYNECFTLAEQLSVIVYPFLENFIEFISQVDLFIGSGGTAIYDRFLMNVPNIIIAGAANQVDVCEEFNKRQLAYYVGNGATTKVDDWVLVLDKITKKPELFSTYSQKSQNLVDGKGGDRIVDTFINEIL